MSDLKPFLENLRGRIVLSDIIRESVRIHKNGRIYKALCPFHKEKTPSFNIDDQKGFYHCFGCGAHGDAVAFVMEQKNMPFLDAVDYLAASVGLQRPKSGRLQQKTDKSIFEAMQSAMLWYQQQLKTTLGNRAMSYLEQRGFSAKVIEKFSLGYSPTKGLQVALLDQGFSTEQLIRAGLLVVPENGKLPYERFRDRLMFPIRDIHGRVIAFGGRILGDNGPKYLNSPETELFSKGHLLYNLLSARQAAKQQSIIVVEGYTDVISLHQAGIEAAVAPLGTALTEDQMQLLWRTDKNPVLCFDGDKAGRSAAIRAANRSLPELMAGHSLSFCFLPEGEDPDSFLKKNGTRAFNEIISNAKPLSDVLWEEFLEQTPLSTPEAKAGAWSRLKQILNDISDPSVKHFYESDFKSRLGKEIFQRNKYRQTFVKSVDLAGKRPRPGIKKAMGHKILLATLINHPKLVDDVLDKLLELDFADTALTKLREILVDSAELEDVTCNKLRHIISDDPVLSDFIEQLDAGQLYVHASFVKQQTDDQTALSGWQEVWHAIHIQPEVKNDIASAVRDLKASFDADSWERLRQLKQGEAMTSQAADLVD